MVQISQKAQILLTSLVACGIEGALIAFYDAEESWVQFNERNYYEDECGIDCTGFTLQLVCAILMLIGFLVIFALALSDNEFRKLMIIGNVIFMTIAIILGGVGMGLTFYRYEFKYYGYKVFNYVLAFWFMEVALMLIGLMNQYIMYRESDMQTFVNGTAIVPISIPPLPQKEEQKLEQKQKQELEREPK